MVSGPVEDLFLCHNCNMRILEPMVSGSCVICNTTIILGLSRGMQMLEPMVSGSSDKPSKFAPMNLPSLYGRTLCGGVEAETRFA